MNRNETAGIFNIAGKCVGHEHRVAPSSNQGLRMNRLLVIALAGLFVTPTWAQSILLINTDVPCELTVNGVSHGQLDVDETRPVGVLSGEQMVVCRSGKARVEHRTEVQGAQQRIIDLEVQAKLNAITAALIARYYAPGDDTVVDRVTGMAWTQSDKEFRNGDWHSASRYCASLCTAGGGWRLPTTYELATLYDEGNTLRAHCGDGFLSCRVSRHFDLSVPFYWSMEWEGNSDARIFSLESGSRLAFPSTTPQYGALCVRRIPRSQIEPAPRGTLSVANIMAQASRQTERQGNSQP